MVSPLCMHTQECGKCSSPAPGIALLMYVHDKLGGASWCCSWPIKFDATYAVGNLISGSCTFTGSVIKFCKQKAKVVGAAKVLCHDRRDTVLT